MYPKAKGVTKMASGLKPVLANDSDRNFIVDPKVFIVWSLCNGKNNIDEIKMKFGNKLGLDKGESDDTNVGEIITSLQRIGLVET
ncbi:MAG: hypothetical protein V1875_03270 [Candidatus Altiarchaeota archaeon]